jgi:hypothetical protein
MGAILDVRCPIGCKSRPQLVPRYAFTPIELGDPAINLGADGYFVSLKAFLAVVF